MSPFLMPPADVSLHVFLLQKGLGDVNDVFRVEIQGVRTRQSLKTVRSVFRLIHVSTGCAVHSHNKPLPKWYSYMYINIV